MFGFLAKNVQITHQFQQSSVAEQHPGFLFVSRPSQRLVLGWARNREGTWPKGCSLLCNLMPSDKTSGREGSREGIHSFCAHLHRQPLHVLRPMKDVMQQPQVMPGRFGVDLSKNSFMGRVVRHSIRLPSEVWGVTIPGDI